VPKTLEPVEKARSTTEEAETSGTFVPMRPESVLEMTRSDTFCTTNPAVREFFNTLVPFWHSINR
jgi:hypothetical protein